MYETLKDLLVSMTYGFDKKDEFKIKVKELIQKYPIIGIVSQAELLKSYYGIHEEAQKIVVDNLFINKKIKNDKKCINAVSKWSMFPVEYLYKHNRINL